MSLANPGVRTQRWIVLGALLLLMAAVVAVPQLRNDAGATTQAQVQPYLPFPCLGAGQTAWPGRRQTMPLYDTSRKDGSSTSTSATDPGVMYPCVSGVQWQFTFGKTSDSTQRGQVNQVQIEKNNPGTLYWAENGSANGSGGDGVGDIYHLSFNSFVVTNPTASGGSAVVMKTVKGTPTSGGYPSSYSLQFNPTGAITIGGNNVLTDLWVTGSSDFKAQGQVCVILCAGIWVDVSISTYNSITWLLSSNNFPLAGVNLNFYYLVTHKNDPGNPYDAANAPSGTSISLPNTSVTVTP
jgi:hypothetical protein